MKKIKVVEISGLRGILALVYGAICLAGGFILFPAWALMSLWNLFGTYVYRLPQMNLIQGFMLYAVLVLLYFATGKKQSGIGIYSETMSKSNLATLMKDIDKDN